MFDMRKKIYAVFICLLTLFIVSLYIYYYVSWKPLWSLEHPKTIYTLNYQKYDTLRIVMIGDSWVGMRTDTLNIMFQNRMSAISGRPVILKSKGKGGEKSRGIYQLMYKEDSLGTKSLLETGADYCVVFAGINDAAANLGKKQYVYHMRLIIDLLLKNDIRPILIEIPNINIWNVYGGKPIKDLVVDFIRSLMTRCGIYNFPEYREALRLMLEDSQLLDSVIFVPMNGWNGENFNLNEQLFLEDQIHLNHKGYMKLDSCIINTIIRKLQ